MIGYQIYRVLNKLLKLIDVSVLYKTSKGIKSLNQLMQSQSQVVLKDDVLILSGKDLYLGFDALKDEQTLVGVNIQRSPHYYLMDVIDNDENIKQTDYCKRYRKGTLDSRSAGVISEKDLFNYKEIFQHRKKQIIEESYEPVQVYMIEGKYYIADGKHRAALCTYLNKSVSCVDIGTVFLKDSFRQWMYRKMCKSSSKYEKNISLFKKV
ncbi:hypothetical protein [Tetragenococcus halophilus]|uniref:hypothetical protein n=1 Tax=Tetragenococcus halophilus TaxID=51669 RepID=UPI001031DBAA|nr:hypothetical protein [Tetragenococcus halophilus]MDN6572412.1 hypothetical protein [Staphylococcus equorum]MDN6736170.1 hypothetical protein [Tetragenococcus koreensis]MCF1675843.1 hypothetical protein [Tetragenococcus halophilus]MCO7027474.1 hypothetical protein [Tetragenococcus halophilus]MDN6751187.1 hypothetical protein [Staphylococcus equorum]